MYSETKSDRRRKLRGLAAGAVGACLLLGSTYALWVKSVDVEGAAVQYGYLSLDTVGESKQYDVSATSNPTDDEVTVPCSGSTGHVITNPAVSDSEDIDPIPPTTDWTEPNWLMAPGDVTEVTSGFHVDLSGDNLVAQLKVDFGDVTLAELETVKAQACLFDGTNWQQVTGDWEDASSGSIVVSTIDSPRASQDDGTAHADADVTLTRSNVANSGDYEGANVIVVLQTTASNDAGSPDPGTDEARMGKVLDLNEMKVTLQQVRA